MLAEVSDPVRRVARTNKKKGDEGNENEERWIAHMSGKKEATTNTLSVLISGAI